MNGDAAAGPPPDRPSGGPPRPRSIVFDLFGDYVRYAGGAIRLRTLARLLAAFSIPDDTTRVAMQRLRREGWFESERVGRETVYRPTDRAWRVLDEGRDRIFRRVGERWDGQWFTVVLSVPEADRGTRDRLRRRLAWLGFGGLAPGVWISAHDRFAEVEAALAEERSSSRAELLYSRSRGAAADREIARRCWDLVALDRDYASFARGLERRLASGSLERTRGARALVARVELVHRYRMFPFRDPDLPPALLPANWHGAAAHELFLAAHEALRPAAEAWFGEVLAEGPSAAQLLEQLPRSR